MKTVLLAALAFVSFSFTKPAEEKSSPEKKQTVQLIGTYQSKKGVMHNASCHGNNIGILTQDTGENIVICFDEMPNGKDIKVNCKSLIVEGNYRQHSIPGGDGPCKAGKITILYVTSWECEGEDEYRP